jgi:hypothetical protein
VIVSVQSCEALADAQPDVRSAGVEALASLGRLLGLPVRCFSSRSAFSWTFPAKNCCAALPMQRVLAAMSTAEARAAHVSSVRERHAALVVDAASASSGGAAAMPGDMAVLPRPSSSAAVLGRSNQGPTSGRGGVAMVFTAAAEEDPVESSSVPSVGPSLQAAAAALQSRRSTPAMLPPKAGGGGSAPAALSSSSSGPSAARGGGSGGSSVVASSSVTAGRMRRASDAVSQHSDSAAEDYDEDGGSGGIAAASRGIWGPPQICDFDTAAADPHVEVLFSPVPHRRRCADHRLMCVLRVSLQALFSLHESSMWTPGVVGFRENVGRAKPAVVSTFKDVRVSHSRNQLASLIHVR